jgi:hypothetical protein
MLSAQPFFCGFSAKTGYFSGTRAFAATDFAWHLSKNYVPKHITRPM